MLDERVSTPHFGILQFQFQAGQYSEQLGIQCLGLPTCLTGHRTTCHNLDRPVYPPFLVDICFANCDLFFYTYIFFQSGEARLKKTCQQSNVPGRVPWPRPSDFPTREGRESLLSTGSGAGDLSTYRTSNVQSGLCKYWRLIRMTQYEQSSPQKGKVEKTGPRKLRGILHWSS